jgi:hypothetical protein
MGRRIMTKLMMPRLVAASLLLALISGNVLAASVGQLDAGFLLGRLAGAGSGPPLAVPLAASSLTDGNTGTGAIVHATSPTIVTPVLTTPAMTGGTSSGMTFTTSTITSPAITGGTYGGGTFTTATITSPAITGGTHASATFDAPTLTGATVAPTPTAGDASTKIATTAYVQTEITDMLAGAITLGSNLSVAGNLGVTGTLGVTGATTLSTLTVGAATLGDINAGTVASGYVTVTTTGATVAGLSADSVAGTAAWFSMKSAGDDRWIIAKSSETETGLNAGSNFTVARFNDVGTFTDFPIFVYRDTGAVILKAPTSAAGLQSGAIWNNAGVANFVP